jgi:putative transposase
VARLTRLVVAGHPHLIVQRGINRQPISTTAEDRRSYVDALREVARVHGVAVHAYALLESEALILATPSAAEGISKMMQGLGRRYVGGFNKRHQRSGTLFEGRFRATVIETAAWFWKCMLFVERLGGTPDADAVTASSAPHHLGRLVDPIIWEHVDYWTLGNTPFEREAAYKLLHERGLDDDDRRAIVAAADKGWPLGSGAFLEHLSLATERRLIPLKRGRRSKGQTPA